jgi:hypothetical protein
MSSALRGWFSIWEESCKLLEVTLRIDRQKRGYLAVMGAKKAGKSVSEKKAMPVVSSVMGVISAATPQPKRLKITRPVSQQKNKMIQ